MTTRSATLLILGNQLFEPRHLPPPGETTVFMAEDFGLCTYVRHHQQKIVLFLAAMRAYRDELRTAGYDVVYHELDPDDRATLQSRLSAALSEDRTQKLQCFDIEDKPFEKQIVKLASDCNVELESLGSPMFVTSRQQFSDYLGGVKKPLMAEFYKSQRRRLELLLSADSEPLGGRWSFDADNRKKLPKNVQPPKPAAVERTAHVEAVIRLVAEQFSDHPGDAQQFWWPTTRQQASDWLDDFLNNRLASFGPYEDAFTQRSATVFHSALTPSLNIGLLTPADVLERLPEPSDSTPLQSIEGFVRQIVGWREFIRGIYRHFSETQEDRNFFGHERELTASWYDGATGIVPLDDAIQTCTTLGWTHHIPRLMVLGNLMTLCEIEPRQAHRWFMEMYVDSSEWVMGPNVYGMGLFSDGGLFATKPYICGSNYLLKMSDYGKGPWCDIVDGLYWRFIDKHRDFFGGNPRLALMPRALDRLKDDRRQQIFAAADEFLETHTQ